MQFERITERVGIRGRVLREANGEGRSQSSLTFHSLRHGFRLGDGKCGRVPRTAPEADRSCQRANERTIDASRA